MINVLEQMRKKSEDWMKGAASPSVMSSGETASRTAGMMNRPSAGMTTMPLGDSSVMVQNGGLTPAEQQTINTETAKGGIRDRTKTQNNMYQKEAFTSLLPGGLAGAQKRIEEGTASLNDMLATGNRSSRYGGFGEVRENVADNRMIRGPYGGGASEERTRMRTRDVTEQEYLDNFNEPKRKMFDESNARMQVIKDQNSQRDHEANLAQINAESKVKPTAPYTTMTTGSGGFVVNKETGEVQAAGGTDPMKAVDAMNDSIYHYQDMINDPDADPKAKAGYKALRDSLIAKRDKALGIGLDAPAGGEGGDSRKPKLTESKVFTHSSGRQYKRNPDGSVEWL